VIYFVNAPSSSPDVASARPPPENRQSGTVAGRLPLRPIVDAGSQARLREVILDAYREHEAAVAEATA
jgi:hypothetical protein